jgi:hypothetical protein
VRGSIVDVPLFAVQNAVDIQEHNRLVHLSLSQNFRFTILATIDCTPNAFVGVVFFIPSIRIDSAAQERASPAP